MDVSKPGKQTAVAATARPVIVTNRAIMHDPMMTGPVSEEQPAAKISVPSASKLVIKPISDDDEDTVPVKAEPSVTSIGAPNLPIDEIKEEKPAKPEPKAKAEAAPEEPVKEEPAPAKPAPEKPAPAEEPAAEPTAADTSENTAEPEFEPVTITSSVPDDVNVPASNESSIPSKEAAKAEAELKQQQEIDKLIADKTYFLPINAVGLRRSRRERVMILVLAIILLAVLAVLMLDVGLVTIPGIAAPTDFF